MRETLFRGKLNANGEWAYGCIKIEPDKSMAIITPDDEDYGYGERWLAYRRKPEREET